jgi:hypothetical protein
MAGAAEAAVKVVFKGDAKGAVAAAKQVKDSTGKLASGFKGVGLASAGLIGVGVGAWLTECVNKAKDTNLSVARLSQQVKNSGADFGAWEPKINDSLSRLSELSSFTKGDLRTGLTTLIQMTGSTEKGLGLMGLAADIAAAKQIPVADAAKKVGMVLAGNTRVLKEFGIKTREGATAQDYLAEIQAKASGQAKVFGDSEQGALNKANNAYSALQVTIGQKLLPSLVKVAQFADRALDAFNSKGNKPFVDAELGTLAALVALKLLWPVIATTVGWLKGLGTSGVEAAAGETAAGAAGTEAAGGIGAMGTAAEGAQLSLGLIGAALVAAGATIYATSKGLDFFEQKLGKAQGRLVGGFSIGLLTPAGPLMALNRYMSEGAAKLLGMDSGQTATGKSAATMAARHKEAATAADTLTGALQEQVTTMGDLNRISMTESEARLADMKAHQDVIDKERELNAAKKEGKLSSSELKIKEQELVVAKKNLTFTGEAAKRAQEAQNAAGSKAIGIYGSVKSSVAGATREVRLWSATKAGNKAPQAMVGARANIGKALADVDRWNRAHAKDINAQVKVGIKIAQNGRITIGGKTTQILAYAQGGIVPATSGGRLAVVGEGGSDEAVIPLNRTSRARDLLAEAARRIAGSAAIAPATVALQFNGDINLASSYDVDTMMTDAVKSARRELRAQGVMA